MLRVGIDLGGTNIKVGVVDENHKIIGRADCKTNLPRPSDEIVQDMARLVKEAVKNAGAKMDDVEHIGIGSPGVCNVDTGAVEYSCNLAFRNVPVCDRIRELTGKKAFLGNDANVAALAEAVCGAGKGASSCVCVTLGTGVGGGIILDGKIFTGYNYAGGELGHTVIVDGGEQCACGRKGCWEAYASATALIRQTRRAMEKHPDSKMWELTGHSLDSVSGRTAFDAMRAGDEAGTAVVKQYIHYIAVGLTDMINIFQPEVLCIGGGICKEGETLLKPLREEALAGCYGGFNDKQTRLCVATLGNDAGIIGAACLE